MESTVSSVGDVRTARGAEETGRTKRVCVHYHTLRGLALGDVHRPRGWALLLVRMVMERASRKRGPRGAEAVHPRFSRMASAQPSFEPKGAPRPDGRQKRAVFVAAVVYAGVAALRATSLQHAPTWIAAVVAVLLVFFGTKPRPTDGPSDDGPRQLATFGLGFALAVTLVPVPLPLPSTLASIGAAVATVAALRALERATGPASVVSKRGRVSLVFPIVACAPAALASFRLALLGLGQQKLANGLPSSAAIEAVLPAGALFFAALLRMRDARLELGTRERTRVAFGLTVFFPAFAALLAGASSLPFLAHVRFFAAVAGLALTWVLGHGEPVQIARVSRRALALAVYLGPVCGLGALFTWTHPAGAPAYTFVTGIVVLALSLLVPSLETSFLPDSGKLLSAVSRAHSALLESEASEAVRLSLEHLREASGPRGGSPELWMLSPPRVLSIDAAGYPHTRKAELPRTLVDVCTAEPFGMLRTEVLRSLEVRRPDLRGLLAWLSDRGALGAVVVAAGGEAEGVLLVPGVAREEPLALEEALGLKKLADGLSAACQGESALSRSLGRERDARERAELATDRVERIGHRVSLDENRNVAVTTRIARPAHVGVYSTTIRMTYETLERRVHRGAPVVLVAPSGHFAVPYVARAHLTGPRRTRPFVVVDAAATQEHDLAAWKDPATSPLGLADTGLLLVVDVAALPHEVQRLIARSLADKRCPWERAEPLDVTFAVTSTRPPEELAEEGELDPQLVSRLGDAAIEPIVFPRLGERAEDLRAIVTDALAREGMRFKGKPVGLDDRAFARLVEYDFPGEDAELTSLACRLVRSISGDVVGVSDLERVLGRSADRDG